MTTASFVSEWPEWFPELLPGLWESLKLTAVSLAIALPLGLVLGLMVDGRSRIARWFAIALVEVGRGTPLLVVIYLLYFGLPQKGIILEGFTAAVLAIGLSGAAYSSEIFRAGLLAVPPGQREASRALGLSSWKELRLVILPQALRAIIPPILGFAILVLQGTALAYAIGVPELLSRAYNIGVVSFMVLEVLVLAALMYAAVAIPISQAVGYLERRSLKRT